MKTHLDFITEQIQAELDLLFSTFDTRLLASAMLLRGAQALRACHSTGMWRVEDVQVVVQGALKDIYEPLPPDQLPKVAQTGNPGSIQ